MFDGQVSRRHTAASVLSFVRSCDKFVIELELRLSSSLRFYFQSSASRSSSLNAFVLSSIRLGSSSRHCHHSRAASSSFYFVEPWSAQALLDQQLNSAALSHNNKHESLFYMYFSRIFDVGGVCVR